MSSLSVKYLNNFLKGSFVIKNLPYVNAAVSRRDENRPELQPEVEQRTGTGVCVCVCVRDAKTQHEPATGGTCGSKRRSENALRSEKEIK